LLAFFHSIQIHRDADGDSHWTTLATRSVSALAEPSLRVRGNRRPGVPGDRRSAIDEHCGILSGSSSVGTLRLR
jgi:hypothetical protein